jgi:hypothetical protein
MPHRPQLARRGRACAWLSIASLVALCLFEPLHGPFGADRAHSDGSRRLAELVASDAHAPLHDAGSCQVCRASSQMRSGLRDANASVSPQPLLQDLGPAATPPLRPPLDLRSVWPRAPPVPSAA